MFVNYLCIHTYRLSFQIIFADIVKMLLQFTPRENINLKRPIHVLYWKAIDRAQRTSWGAQVFLISVNNIMKYSLC